MYSDGNVKYYNYNSKVRLVVKYVNTGIDHDTFKPYEFIQYIKVNKAKTKGWDFDLVEDPKEATVFIDYFQAELYKRKCMSGDRIGNMGKGTTKIVARAVTR